MTQTANAILENVLGVETDKTLKMTAEEESVTAKPVENGFPIEKDLDDSLLMEDDALSFKLHLSDDEDELNPKSVPTSVHSIHSADDNSTREATLLMEDDDVLKSIDEVLNDEEPTITLNETTEAVNEENTTEVGDNEDKIEENVLDTTKIVEEENEKEVDEKGDEEIEKEILEDNEFGNVEVVEKEKVEEEVLKELMEVEEEITKDGSEEKCTEKGEDTNEIENGEEQLDESEVKTAENGEETERVEVTENVEEIEKIHESEEKSEEVLIEKEGDIIETEKKLEESTEVVTAEVVESVEETQKEIEENIAESIEETTDVLVENQPETESTETAEIVSEDGPSEIGDSLIMVNMELTEEKNRELEEENIEDLDKPEDDESDEKESEQDDENATAVATSTDITEDEDLSQDTNDNQPTIMSVQTLDEETSNDVEDFTAEPNEDSDKTEESEKRKLSEVEDDLESKRPKLDEKSTEVVEDAMDIEDPLSPAISVSLPEPEESSDPIEDSIEPSQTPTPDLPDLDLLKKRPLDEEPNTPEPKKQKCEESTSDLPKTEKKPEKKREKLILQMLPKIFKDESIPDMDIEEFILTKLIEAISQRTELAQLRFKAQKQETIIEQLRKKTTHLTKQLEDIATVTNRLSIDLQNKDRPVAPVKITRSVGLQVAMPLPQAKRYNPPTIAPKPRQKPKPAPKPTTAVSPVKTPTTTPIKGPVPKTPPTVLNKTLARPSPNIINKNNKPVIDLTDEEDTSKKPPTPNLIPLNSGNIRLVPSSNANTQSNQVTYLMTTPNGIGQNRQLLIATSGNNVQGQRPTVVNQPPRGQTQTPVRYMIQNTSNGQTALVQQRPGVVLTNGVRSVPVRMNTPNRTQNRVAANSHPAALPIMLNQPHLPNWRQIPPRPSLKIGRAKDGGIQLSWSMPELDNKIHEDVASYQLYAYQEGTAPPSSDLWRKVGDVKALPLPMACTLTSFHPGNKYYFAVRAIDVHSRVSPFSYAQPISLLN